MKSTVVLVAGLTIGFSATLTAVAAIGLALLGFGGGILARQSPSVATVIGYDPSDVVLISPVVGLVSLLLITLGVVIYSRVGRAPRRGFRADAR